MVNDIIIRVKVIDEARKNLEKLATQFKTMDAALKEAGVPLRSWNKIAKQNNLEVLKGGMVLDKLTGQTMSYGKAARVAQINTRRFRMEFLGIMFFGMQLQRTFKGMTISTTKFFMKVTEGQTEAGQAITRLSASWQFLKFSLGEAIAEFIKSTPFLLDMLDTLSQWVQENKKLSAGIVLSLLVIGSGMFTFAQLGLAAQALDKMFPAVAGAIKGGFGKIFASGIKIGISLFLVWKGYHDIMEGIKEGDMWKSVKGILEMGLAGAIIGSMIAGLAGAGAGFLVGISLGLVIKWFFVKGKQISLEEEMEIQKERTRELEIMGKITPTIEPPKIEIPEINTSKFKKDLTKADEYIKTFKINATQDVTEISNEWQQQWQHALGIKKLSYPLGWMLIQVEKQWEAMSTKAQMEIWNIINEINNIPREVVTIHRVITVYERGGIL